MNDSIDEFESIFQRADSELLAFVDIPIRHVAVVTDGSQSDSALTVAALQAFLPRLDDSVNWRVICKEQYRTVEDLLMRVDEQQTDLIITYRHLQERAFVPQHSLGVYLDAMTQTTSIPVLVLPGTAVSPVSIRGRVCERVMVMADQLRVDNRLVNYGTRVCTLGGTVWLCHIEDERVFERYLQVLQRIPEIQAGDARQLIQDQLLNEARDFIEGCEIVIREAGPEVQVRSHIDLGHHLQDYRRLVREHQIDLLVVDTKDEDQLAMSGRAYSVSVELTDVAMLLL